MTQNINIKGHLPKTYFSTSWLSDKSGRKDRSVRQGRTESDGWIGQTGQMDRMKQTCPQFMKFTPLASPPAQICQVPKPPAARKPFNPLKKKIPPQNSDVDYVYGDSSRY